MLGLVCDVDRGLLVMKEVPQKAGSPGSTRTQLYGTQLTTRGHCLPGGVQDPGICRQPGPVRRGAPWQGGSGWTALWMALYLIKTGIKSGVAEAPVLAVPACTELEKQLCGRSFLPPFPSFCLN